MTILPSGFDYHGIYCYRSADTPHMFFYIPGEPTPEKDPAGKSTLSLWVTGEGALFQLGVHWGLDADIAGELQAYLVQHFPDLDPDMLRLSPAPVSVAEVTLNLGDGAGALKVLKTSSSSGMPPYSALFSMQLSAEEKAQVTAAINGRSGFLTVEYRASLPVAVSATTTISGDMSVDIVQLSQQDTLSEADCLAQIETALAEQRLTISRTGTGDVPDDLRIQADAAAKEKMANALFQLVHNRPGHNTDATFEASHLLVSASRTKTLPVPIDRTTDVSSWFTNGSGAEHIHILPAANL
jgi:hypothetical protein